mmetsp:Transcript_26203/g.56491  ORF Transcript_26203/g.56491 Transcript_26203/m.56491 type:complete len:1199 (+) Transcript_26203:258-3854(+)
MRGSFYITLAFQLLLFLPSSNHLPWHHSNSNSNTFKNQNTVSAQIIDDNNSGQCTTLQDTTNYMSTPSVVSKVLNYLDAHRTLLENTIFRSYTDHHQNVTKPSTQYKYADFRSALEWMAGTGVERGETARDRGGGERLAFYMGPDNCNGDGWHVGLANVAAFLGQSMTMVILNDTCDELNWEMVFPRTGSDGFNGFYPLSNACGQHGVSYTSSPPHNECIGTIEEKYACDVDPYMTMTSQSRSPFEGDAPPPLQCFPRTPEQTTTGHYDPMLLNEIKGGMMVNEEGNVWPSYLGRTDVEGCCWWGRGALHTKGVCNLGKLNYYLGKRAADEGRESKYGDIDFCANPEATCSDDERTMEMRWIVALFEWVERVQTYENEENGWNYIEELTKFTMDEGDLIGSIKFSFGKGEPTHFVDEVGGVLDQGCPFPPCNRERPQRLRWRTSRKQNFITAVEGVGLPVKSESYRATEDHFLDPIIKGDLENKMLQSKSPLDGTMYQSYRYHFDDFMESLRKMSDIGFGINSEDITDYTSHFYIGQGVDGWLGSNSGKLNIALFMTYAIEMSILDDACDEHNTQKVNGRYPVSNACGMYGASYQDMVCDDDGEDKGMECPLDASQSLSGVTRASDYRAPQPFKCAPKSQYPITGFWDEARLEENHKTAFTNQIGRIDVEGCCWWGRGVLRKVTQGRCFYGQLNYHLGKRAATEGRPSLYPKIDFCEFPEAVCASEHSNELRWVSGMFYWIRQIQSHDEDGWNYMEKIREQAIELESGAALDPKLVTAVGCVLKTGSVDCVPDEYLTERASEVLALTTGPQRPTESPTLTSPPSSSPTGFPIVAPTETPTMDPTATNPPTGAPNTLDWPSPQDVDLIIRDIEEQRGLIEEQLLTPRIKIDDENLYNFDMFMSALKVFADRSIDGLYFYVGHGVALNYARRKRGLINVAAFLAHSKTLAVHDSVCDERNTDGLEGRYHPLSNSCGQYGKMYQNMRCTPKELEKGMECPPDPGMQISAVDELTGREDDPPPFFCGPKTYFPFTGYYDGETKQVMNDEPFANRGGRMNVEACCWWGRGAAQVKGVCMYGKLNYYLGAKAKKDGRRSLFPTVDFCKNPQAICSGKYSYSLMWVTALLSWVETVQSRGIFSENLDRIADGKMGYEEFIDFLSDEVLGSGEDDKRETRANFLLAVDALGLRQTRQKSITGDAPN